MLIFFIHCRLGSRIFSRGEEEGEGRLVIFKKLEIFKKKMEKSTFCYFSKKSEIEKSYFEIFS